MQANFNYIGYMEDPHITTDVIQQIRKIKERKSAGPDGIKPDVLKILGNDIQCINILAESMNKIITRGQHIMVYIKDSTGTQNKETNSKGSATNSIDKCNLQIIYGNSKDQNLTSYQIHQG